MATGAAADGLFRCIYEGCISGCDSAVERRPYHRNCSCALHNKSRPGNSNCPHSRSKTKNVSYPVRRSWSEGCLVLAAAAACNSNSSSPSCSPAFGAAAGRTTTTTSSSQLGWGSELEDDEDQYYSNRVSFKV
ncbi:uncharacterized protein LOC110815682 [Carica papaya]|uniref:uncharacterized protein LOC110815682 n=1 Tax=Carica papaya TaxID=3649 RepID=UPI000B8CA31F|nr:uncharacterized protein LOC110815682 [Carica papaya]